MGRVGGYMVREAEVTVKCNDMTI